MKQIFLISLLLTLATTTQAKSKKDTCITLESCVSLVSKITDKKYVYDEKLKGQVYTSKNFLINSKNADQFISNTLNHNGYTRIASNEADYRIISARDVRYNALPIYKANLDLIPNHSDYIMVSYKLKHGLRSTEITRSFRPFMSRYGRIIDVKSSGTIIMQDTATNIKRLLKLVKDLDVKPSSDEEDNREKYNERRFELDKLKAQNCHHFERRLDRIERRLEK